jgi:hypothetical protein
VKRSIAESVASHGQWPTLSSITGKIGLFLAAPDRNTTDVRNGFITQIVEDCSEDGLISTRLLRVHAEWSSLL